MSLYLGFCADFYVLGVMVLLTQQRRRNVAGRKREDMNLVSRIWNDDRGQDLIEYALMAGFVAVAAGAIFGTGLVPKLKSVFTKVEETLGEAAPAAE
jgi:Flp pilus assembly pilin Flp